MTMAGAATSVLSAIRSIKSIGEIWTDDSISTGEKFTKTLGALVGLLPIAIGLFNKEKIAVMSDTAAKLLGIPADYAKAASGAAAVWPLLVFVAIAAAVAAAAYLIIKSFTAEADAMKASE
jgi:hypothetical protein